MAFSSGTFSRLYDWTTDAAGAVKIRADRMDAEMDGMATGLSSCILKDGTQTITADIPFNDKAITGLKDQAGATHAMNRQSSDARYIGAAAITTVASATTCDIGAAVTPHVSITGTTTITGFGTTASVVRIATFTGALTLTHHATSLILPGAANITTAAGDTAIFGSDASGNWRCYSYQKAAGLGLNQTESDARYTRNANDLSAETGIDVADIMAFWDTSASANKKITYQNAVIDIFATAAAAGYSEFAAGTKMIFDQAAAPTGWTKQTTYNDAAIRIVSGVSGGTTVGTTGFTTRFAATGNTPAGTVGNTTLTEAQLASHNHTLAINILVNNGDNATTRDTVNNANTNTGSAGSNSTHTHSFTGSALDLSVKYRDMISATKD